MVLWTIHTTDWYELFKRTGSARGSWDHAFESYLPAYRWMASQMKARIGGERIRTAPLWTWSSYSGANKCKPDLRATGHLPRGTCGVRIEFQIDESKVLLSDFQMWHFALNSWYLPLTAREDRQWDLEQIRLSKQSKQRRIEESWSRMFDIGTGSHRWWGKPSERQIQACFWNLEQRDVISVKHFVAR